LPLALLLVLRTRNNTDGNKLVIFFGIASYYGDNYVLSIYHHNTKLYWPEGFKIFFLCLCSYECTQYV